MRKFINFSIGLAVIMLSFGGMVWLSSGLIQALAGH